MKGGCNRRPATARAAGSVRVALSAFAAALAVTALLASAGAHADDAAWRALASGGHAMIVRHAATDPGVGDPPGFRIEDCATQRNLSAAGREQAASMRRALAEHGVAFDLVLSSRWCRCLDTARIAFGRVDPWPALDSFFDDRSRAPAQAAEVRMRVSAWRGPGNLALVTHQVNITELTGVVPAPGEAVVLKPREGGQGFEVVGRVAF